MKYSGTNQTMMTKAGIPEKVQKHVTNAYRLVFHGQNSLFDSTMQIKQQVPDSKEIQNIVNFLQTTKEGVITKM